MHGNLRPPDVASIVLSCFLAKFVLRMRSNWYFSGCQLLIKILTSPLNSATELIKESSNLATRRRFHAVTLISDTWSWTFVVHPVSSDQTLYQIWPKSNNSRWSYWWLSNFLPALRHAATLTFDPLTPWTFVVHRVSRVQTLYKCQRNWTIPGWVVDDLACCHRPILGVQFQIWRRYPRYKIQIYIKVQPFKVKVIQDNYTTLLDALTKYQTRIILLSLSLRKFKKTLTIILIILTVPVIGLI